MLNLTHIIYRIIFIIRNLIYFLFNSKIKLINCIWNILILFNRANGLTSFSSISAIFAHADTTFKISTLTINIQ